MSTVTRSAHAILMQAGCGGPECADFSWKLHRQLSNGYRRGASVLPLLFDMDEYLAEHRTARKRSARAARLGYRFGEIDRRDYADDVYRINTSTPERQGRPMSAGYQEHPRFGANPQLCPFHHVYTYGVTNRRDQLAAYLWLYRCGELAMVSSILGHADLLADDVMYLLGVETIREQRQIGGTMFYNLHASGTDGLRYFKERLGFRQSDVEWIL